MTDRSISVYLRAQVADFKRGMAEAAEAVKKPGQEALKSETSLGKLVESATKNREAWDRAGTTLTAFGVGTVAALGASAKAAIDWESAWAGVAKTVDGTDAQLAQVEDGLRELARTLPASHQEIAATAEAAGQLGVATEDIVGFTETMINLSETTNLSADEAATSIAQMMNVMQTAPEDVDNLGASLVALGNNGASTERDIIQMAQRIAGAGKIVGLTEGEVMGLANALASTGIEVEAGGSAISNIMIDISKAVSAGGADLEAWAKVAGMSADDFAAAWRSDPADALTLMIEGLGQMNAAGGDVFATLSDLGQTDIRVTRALLSMANSGDLLRKSLELGNSAWEENTALIAEAEKRYDTTEAKLQVAKNSINDAAITLGESFLPAIAGAAEGVADFAQWLGSLPDPVQKAAAGLGGLVGVTSLLAGGFLLTFPRVIETVQAFRRLSEIAPTLASGLGKVGRAASIVGSAMAVMAASSAIPRWGVTVSEGAGVATQALLDVASGAQTADEAFASMFASGSLKDWFTGNDIDGIEKAYATLKDPSVSQNIDNVVSSILTLGQTTSTNRLQAQELFDTIDQGLASLVQSGAADQAADALAAMGIELEGNSDILPLYADALAAADAQQQLTGDSATGAAEGITDLANATAEADEELQEWLDSVAEADANFIGLYDAYDTIVQKNKDVAQSTADATKSSKDSWEDYYDGVTVAIDDYLDELQRQVDAQSNWETNMLLLSGRVSQGVLDELWSMGAEGAPLVAQLVNASDEELARMEDLFGQRSANATNNFANNLNDARTRNVITAAAAQLGQDAANEIARKLSDGTTTVDDIIREYGLVLESNPLQVPLDTELTLAQLSGLLGEISSSSGTLTLMGDTGPAGQALEDVTAQINEAEGTVTIYGDDGSAITTLSAYTATVDAATGAVKIQGTDAEGRATVATLTNWVNSQGTAIQVDANTTQAIQAINALIASQAGRVITLATALGGATGGPVGAIAGFAGGGRVPGASPADPTVDNLLASVDNGRSTIAIRSGEFIQSQPAVDYYGLSAMHAVNSRRIPKDVLRGYAQGGSPGMTPGSLGFQPASPPSITVTGGVTPADVAAAFDGMSLTLVTEAGPIRAIARAEAITVASAQRGSRPR